jgi:hypothetical protein
VRFLYTELGQCNQDCLEDALIEESLFYPVGTVRPGHRARSLRQPARRRTCTAT